MKIAVNTRLLLNDQMEGIGWYTHELMSRVVRNHPEHEFYFIFDRPYSQEFIYAENVIPIILNPPARHVFLISFWFDFSLIRWLKKMKPDLFFSPDSMNSLHPVCKTITTIHDVNFITNPSNFGYLLRRFYSKRTPYVVNSSNKILTVSDFSKKEIIKTLNVPEEKIHVIYNACRDGFKPVSDQIKNEIKSKYTQGKDYFVFVGGLYHRKNLVSLVEAFEIFKKDSKSDLKLLIVGKKVSDADLLIKRISNSLFKNDIILTGRISDDAEVKNILASAFALTYVSVLEGFGIPLVEAMKSGIPIIASNAGSIPEVAGDAALYVDPRNSFDIAQKMTEMLVNEDIRNGLIQHALKQEQKYNWDKSAEALWAVMEQVVKN